MDTNTAPGPLTDDTEVTVTLRMKPLPRRGYPHELRRVSTIAYWARLMSDTPKYKDPMFTILGVLAGPTPPTGGEPAPLKPPEEGDTADAPDPSRARRDPTEGRVRMNPRKMKGPRP